MLDCFLILFFALSFGILFLGTILKNSCACKRNGSKSNTVYVTKNRIQPPVAWQEICSTNFVQITNIVRLHLKEGLG